MAMSQEIGPYQIIEELGQGGMAIVYKALQPSVNRIVALKVLPSNLEDDEVAVRRFRQEAETAANLTHQNIVRVWDASVTSPPYYIAMEFLEGGTLADRLADGPLALEESAAIITCVCAALDHAHQRGVIHRDIKPANIMFDGTNKPVVTDFGIARVAERTRFTMTGASLGTPDYMSPEQTKGIKVDHRTDLYSVGAVLCEMLTGQPPFSGEPLTVMYQIVNEEPPRLAVHRPDIPPGLESAVMRALTKDPEARHQSGEQLAEAIWAAMRSSAGGEATGEPAAARGVAAAKPAPTGDAGRVLEEPREGPVGGLSVAPLRARTPLRERKALLVGILAVVLVFLGVISVFAVRERGGLPPLRALIEVKVCEVSGKLATQCCPTKTMKFKKGDEPNDYCTMHRAYECDECDERFCTQSELTKHMGEMHSHRISDLTPAASSTHRPGVSRYYASYAFDAREDTAWNEGAPGPGIGEYIKATFPTPRRVTKVGVIPGYDKRHAKYGDVWVLNHRLRSARLEFSDGSAQTVDFEDRRDIQYIELSSPPLTTYVKLVIVGVYPTKQWDDTAISEIEIWGYEE